MECPSLVYDFKPQWGMGDLKIANCNDIDCLSKNITTIGNNLKPYQISVALGSDGNPIIVYNSGSLPSNITVLHCLDILCGTYELNIVDSVNTSVPGIHQGIVVSPKIAIAGNGLPVISYRDSGEDSLSFAYCHDIGCGNSTHFFIESGSVFSQDLTIGNDGLHPK